MPAVPPSPRRFVLAHGFTQTARSWDTFAPLLRDRVPNSSTTAVDLPGHGGRIPADDDLWAAADRLTETGGTGTYIGYSMGGRVVLHAALSHPGLVERLVLIGATAGIDDPVERLDRRRSDEALADHLEAVGVEAFLDEWLANPLFAGLTPATDQRADRLRNAADGLAASLRSTGTGTQEPLWDRLDEIEAPVLVIAGERDAKFTAIGERLAAALPVGELAIVPGVGHSAHMEDPAATVDAIVRWFGAVDGAAGPL